MRANPRDAGSWLRLGIEAEVGGDPVLAERHLLRAEQADHTFLPAWTLANYYYRRDCMCAHCVGGFRAWLGTNYSAAQLKEQFAIADLKAHQFAEIPSWHNPKETSP